MYRFLGRGIKPWRAFLVLLCLGLTTPVLAATYTFSGGSYPTCSGGSWSRSGTTYTCTGSVTLASGDRILPTSSITVVASSGLTLPGSNTVGSSSITVNLQTAWGTLAVTGATVYGSLTSASGAVQVSSSTVTGTFTTGGAATVSASTVTGTVSASNGVTATGSSAFGSNVTASAGTISLTGGSVAGNVSSSCCNVTTSNVTVSGSVSSTNGTVSLTGGSVAAGVSGNGVSTNGASVSGGINGNSNGVSITGGVVTGAITTSGGSGISISGASVPSGSITATNVPITITNSAIGSVTSNVPVTSNNVVTLQTSTTVYGNVTAGGWNGSLNIDNSSSVDGVCSPTHPRCTPAPTITKSVSPSSQTLGSNVTFTIVVGTPAAATGVAVDDVLPAGFTYVSSSATVGSYSAATGVWTIGALAANGTATLTLVAQVTQAGTLTNSAAVRSNQFAAGTVAPVAANVTVTQPPPNLAKVASAGSAVLGDTISFTLTVTNPIAFPLSGITVTDTLPTGMSYLASVVTNGSSAVSGQTVTWSIPTLPASGSAQMTLVVQLTANGSLTNTMTSPGATSASATVLVLAKAATHFRMDEPVGSWTGASGEVLDSGGTGLSGSRQMTGSSTTTNVINPNPSIASQYSSVSGSFCNAGSFDGNAVVVVPSNALLGYTTQLSATAWIYPTAYPSGGSDLYSILSNDQNYEFHINPSGKLYWWWNSSSLTSSTTIPLNKWTHVAITMDSRSTVGRERIYINGVLDTNTTNWKGTLNANPCPFYIGGDISTGASCSFLPARNFKGRIDEVKLYNFELSSAEVNADMNLGRQCSGTFDHLEIDHDGNGSACNAETVTIKACLDAACSVLYPGSVTAHLSPTGWVGGDTITFSGGVASAQLNYGSAGTVTLGTTSVSPTPAASTVCRNTATGAASCSMTFAAASCAFDAVEKSAAPKTRIYTKLAGTAFNVDVLALTGTAVNTTYTGTVAVDLVDASTTNCPTGTGLTTASNLTFASGDAGRKNVSFTYANAARNVRVRIKQGSGTPACSFDNFAIRPQQFALTSSMNNTALSGSPVAVAGSSFTITADAGVSSGYDGTPVIDTTKVLDHNGTVIASGTLTGSFGAGTGAQAVGSGFQYTDVGNIQFATDGVTDTTYTLVDQTTDCVANSTSNTLSGGKYGCLVGSVASPKFGRWRPDHFSFAGTLTPACASGGFTYEDQDGLGVNLVLKAHAQGSGAASASDPVLSRYTTGYPRLAPVTVSGDNGGTAVSVTRLTSPAFPTMPNTALWSGGVFTINDTYAFAKAVSPDIFDQFLLKVAVSDPDGATLMGTAASQQTNSTRIRDGRLRLVSGQGSDKAPYVMPVEVQYWTGSSWATNVLDSCTTYASNNVKVSSTGGVPAVSGVSTVNAGYGSIRLGAPGSPGVASLCLDLGPDTGGATCAAGASAGAAYLQFPWTGGTAQDPTATVNFGAAQPTSRAPWGYIYRRENF